jgi:hypothetical protein
VASYLTKEAKVALYGPHLHWCSHRLFHNCPKHVVCQLGIDSGSCKKLAKEVQNVTCAEIIKYEDSKYCLLIRINVTLSNGQVGVLDWFGEKANGSSLDLSEG